MKEREKQPSTYQQPARQKSESPPDERSALTPIRASYLTGQDVLTTLPAYTLAGIVTLKPWPPRAARSTHFLTGW